MRLRILEQAMKAADIVIGERYHICHSRRRSSALRDDSEIVTVISVYRKPWRHYAFGGGRPGATMVDVEITTQLPGGIRQTVPLWKITRKV